MEYKPRRILVGVDLSDCSSAALRLAVDLAAKFGAELTVLHAVVPTAGPRHPLSRAVEVPAPPQRFSAIENDLVQFVRGIIGRAPMPEYRIVEGDPSEAILFAEAYERADLIILGTRGLGGSSRLTLGSVAERILRRASVPVLTICPHRAGEPEIGAFARILCPVNESAVSASALRVAVSLARSTGGKVTVLRVIENGDDDVAAVDEQLQHWLREADPEAIDLDRVVTRGEGGKAILEYAAANAIGLIVVGAQREKYSDWTVIGTTTEQVTRHATCAVLTVIS